MRILLVGPHFLGQWTESTQSALQKLGHDVCKVYYDLAPNESRVIRLSAMSAVWSQQRRGAIHDGLYKRLLAIKNRRLVKLARDFAPHLVMVLKGEHIPLYVLQDIRDHLDVPLVTWWVDDPFRFPDLLETFSFYDRFFVFDWAYISRLEAIGVQRTTLMPCACDPDIYRPLTISAVDHRRYMCEVAFVAGFCSPRDQLVEHLSGLDVAIWGPGWKFPEARPAMNAVGENALRGKMLHPHRAARLYNVAKICMNVHHPQTVFDGLNTRTFEVLACGAFELTDHFPGMHKLLEPGKEVVCYESCEELRELADYYLERPEARAEIGWRGRERVLREHTYQHRMERLLASVDDLL